MTAVLLWSQYVELSLKLRAALERYVPEVKLLCVDSAAVRAKIAASPRLKVEWIPCVLEVSGSQILQYHQDQAVQWVRMKVIQRNPNLTTTYDSDQQPPQQPSSPPQPQYQPPLQPQYQQPPQYPPPQYQPPQQQYPPINENEGEKLNFAMTGGPKPVEDLTQSPDPNLFRGALVQPPSQQPQGPPPQYQGPLPQYQGPPPQLQQGPHQGVTPISMVTPEPSMQAQNNPYSQNIGQYNQSANAHYQQYNPQESDKSMSPKERNFQQVIAQAKAAAEAMKT